MKVVYNIDIQNTTKYIKIYGENAVRPCSNLVNYLSFISQDICMVFTVIVAYNMDIIKIKNAYEILFFFEEIR